MDLPKEAISAFYVVPVQKVGYCIGNMHKILILKLLGALFGNNESLWRFSGIFNELLSSL